MHCAYAGTSTEVETEADSIKQPGAARRQNLYQCNHCRKRYIEVISNVENITFYIKTFKFKMVFTEVL